MPFIFHDQTVAVITVGVTFEPIVVTNFRPQQKHNHRGYANHNIVFECFDLISRLEVQAGPFAVPFRREGLLWHVASLSRREPYVALLADILLS